MSSIFYIVWQKNSALGTKTKAEAGVYLGLEDAFEREQSAHNEERNANDGPNNR